MDKKEIRKYPSIKDNPRFGKIAVDLGFITKKQLKIGLNEQVDWNFSNKPHINLGDIFLYKGWITLDQIIAVLKKTREEGHNVSSFVHAIKHDIRNLTLIILLIFAAILLINLRFLSTILNFIPPVSIVVLFLITFGLVLICIYLSKLIVKNTINELEAYDKKMSNFLSSMQQEVTTRKKLEQKYRSLVDSTDDSIYLIDRNYKYLFMNKNHLSRLDLTEEEYLNKAYSEFHSPEVTELFIQKAEKVFKTGKSAKHEYKSINEDKYFLQTLSPIMDSNYEINTIIIISKEITSLKKAEKKLYSQSMNDELTGLYNRRGFLKLSEQQLKLANRENKKMFLLSSDLDSLKLINDNFGHKRGDLVLSNTANILKKTFRESDIVARIGGDEFIVLGIDSPDTNFETLVVRLRESINAYNAEVQEPLSKISLSYGLAKYDPEHPSTIEELLSTADKIMYEEKRKKK